MRAAAETGTRAALVAAALELFQQRGFEGTRVQDVADRAGCTKGALYHYFPSKLDLLAAINREWDDSVEHRVRTIAERGAGAVDALAAVVGELVGEVTHRRPNFTVACSEIRSAPAPADGSGWRGAVAEIVERGQVGGELRPGPVPAVVVHGIVGMCLLAAFHWSDEGTDLEPADVATTFVELVIRGLATSATPQHTDRSAGQDEAGALGS